ncbi:MAG: hypothetical protein ACN4GW_05455 [Desulforhopalus sp.]
MINLSTTLLLFVVNCYVLLALALFTLSGSDLICQVRKGHRCARRHRWGKFLVAVPLALSCLAVLAIGLFAIGMSHGSQPKTYQLVLFILGCLTPCLLLILWVFGSLLVDSLWCIVVIILLVYFSFINPALYIRCWADDNHQWAQMWMAKNYDAGSGGLKKSDSTARSWYKKAAENGNMEAQYRVAQSARRSKEARKWYRMAAEQGHVGAIIQMVRLSSGDRAERQKWLDQAAASRHPDALFMLAKDAMAKDLPTARKLLLEAAGGKSRSAIIMLIDQYQQGGILFDQDGPSADKWQMELENIPAADTEPNSITVITVNKNIHKNQVVDEKPRANDPDILFRKAKEFLAHPAKDQILHDRAITYLKRAVEREHGEAAVMLAKMAGEKVDTGQASSETIGWLEIAASSDNRYALGELAKYYKNKPTATADDLDKSLAYNIRLLQVMQGENGSRQRFQRQHWSGEYRDTTKKLAQLKRLGGSWQAAEDQAEKDPKKEFLLAEEMIKSRQYNEGMERMQSAAKRGNPDARFELARRVLRGPRSFEQEVAAITDLQELDRLDFLPASLQLAFLYQSGTGVVPKNVYLTRRLLRKIKGDEELEKSAQRLLKSTPDFTDSLQFIPGKPLPQQITRWYEGAAARVEDTALLQQQFETLLEHYADVEQMRRHADENDAQAQYRLAQTLQSHNLSEAMQWLERAAGNGNNGAQYELAVRMIRGKKNTEKTQEAMRRWAMTAADSGHVGAMAFIAEKYKSGRGGFKKNSVLSKQYYNRVLESSSNEILFQEKIAGRLITVNRNAVINSIEKLDNS